MITVYNQTAFKINWAIYKGASGVKEDFSRALVKCFLISPQDKVLVPHEIVDGALVIDVPGNVSSDNLPLGAYDIQAIWLKDADSFAQARANSAKRCLSRLENVFALTDIEEEATPFGESSTIFVKSQVATYGYDGLSAYETAVFYGVTTASTEKEYITLTSGGTYNYNELNNHPQINNVELEGNKSLPDLGIQPVGDYANVADLVDYMPNGSKADKAITGKDVYVYEGYPTNNRLIAASDTYYGMGVFLVFCSSLFTKYARSNDYLVFMEDENKTFIYKGRYDASDVPEYIKNAFRENDATTDFHGLMSTEDRIKLDSMPYFSEIEQLIL